MQSSIQGVHITVEDETLDSVERVTLVQISPALGQLPRVVFEGERQRTATIEAGTSDAEHDAFHRSPSGEAAAATALGSSPTTSSFVTEIERFVSLTVAGKSKQRRRSRIAGASARLSHTHKSCAHALLPASQHCPTPLDTDRCPCTLRAPAAAPARHYLSRVDLPMPTPKHPLAGVWAARCDVGDSTALLLVHTTYSFTASSARVLAVVLAGEGGQAAAGSTLWVARAAAVPQPWPPGEQRVVDEQRQRWLEAHQWPLAGAEEEEIEGQGAGARGGWCLWQRAGRGRWRCGGLKPTSCSE